MSEKYPKLGITRMFSLCRQACLNSTAVTYPDTDGSWSLDKFVIGLKKIWINRARSLTPFSMHPRDVPDTSTVKEVMLPLHFIILFLPLDMARYKPRLRWCISPFYAERLSITLSPNGTLCLIALLIRPKKRPLNPLPSSWWPCHYQL